VTDHDVRVLARKTVRVKAFRLGEALDWAVEADMVAVLAELGLPRLGDIPGLTAAGAAAILAETGGPRRYDSSSSLVKHAGLAPAGNTSGAFSGQAHISRRGRPGLRLAA